MIYRLNCRWMPAILVVFLVFSGCGYTRKTHLPEGISKIYVETVKNKISIENLYVYQPGIEMLITNAIIKRLKQDGNLQVVNSKEEADAILETHLTRFEQEGLRFSSLESVEEYRLFAVVNARLTLAKTKKVLWSEVDFDGDTDYFVSDVRTIARQEASERVADKLAYNLVDRIVEDW